MSISSEQILMRVAMETQTAVMECLCAAVTALGTNSLPTDLNPYYSPPATAVENPAPSPEQFPTEWTLCGAGYGYVEYLARYCDKLAELAGSPIWSGLALLAAVVGGASVALTGGGTVALAIGGASVATALWAWVSTALGDGLTATFTATAGELRTNEPLRRCAVGEFVDNGLVASFQAKVDEHAGSPLVASLINILATQETIDAHRNGIAHDGQLYFPEASTDHGCSCYGEELPEVMTFDFEGCDLQGWYAVNILPTSILAAGTDNTIAHGGQCSLHVIHTAQVNNQVEWRYNLDRIVRDGDRFAMWHKHISGSNDMKFVFRFNDGSSQDAAFVANPPADWSSLIYVMTGANVGKRYTSVSLYFSCGSGTQTQGDWWVDDVSFNLK